MMNSALHTANVFTKLQGIEAECHNILLKNPKMDFGQNGLLSPARDLKIVRNQDMAPRQGLQSREGQARLLHGLANIELQAMELGLRTLYEFTDTATDFRSGLAEIVLDEARHLKLCLDGVAELGFSWGTWPAHNTLWQATAVDDSLLDRLLIVNCYLEASGLDSSDQLLRRLSGVENPLTRKIVDVIAREEVGHVRFGLKWYRDLCAKNGLDSSDDFVQRLQRLEERIPARAAPISTSARKLAGFSDEEIQFITNYSARKKGHA